MYGKGAEKLIEVAKKEPKEDTFFKGFLLDIDNVGSALLLLL